jgi:hypothetical protein
MDLKTRFPITFNSCQEFSKKYKKCEPNFITSQGITYDKSVIPMLSNDDIEYFINLQIKYPEIINNCSDKLIQILEEKEKQIITKKTKKLKIQNTYMKQIYDLLANVNEDNNDTNIIDKWVLFIKSQDEFSNFF